MIASEILNEYSYENKVYYLYRIINKINQKIYIGKHFGNIYDDYSGSGKLINLAYAKYGKENFDKQILFVCNNKEKINELEKYWIKYYRELNYPLYNIADGGDGGDIYHTLSLERQNRIKQINVNVHKGKINSESTCDKIRNKLKGKIFSEEHKHKISKSLTGRKLPNEIRAKISNRIKGVGWGNHKGSKWYTNGIVNIKVQPNEIKDLNSEWKPGRSNFKIKVKVKGHKQTEEAKQKISNYSRRCKRYNNGIINKFVPPEVIKDLEGEWKVGWIKKDK